MNATENKQLEMFTRVQAFGAARLDEFAPDSLGRQLFNEFAASVADLERLAAAESSGAGAARQGTATRRQARAQLRRNLQAIYRTAQAMAQEVRGVSEKFLVPRNNNDGELMNAARAFAIDVLPFKAHFIAREMSQDFLEQLDADIKALEEAISAQSTGRGHRRATAAAIDVAIADSNKLLNRLDALVRTKYRKDRATLAEWTTATHVERPARRKRRPESTTVREDQVGTTMP
jgi:hypothetical protein